MSLSAYPTLLDELKSKDFRRAFRSSAVRNFVALQIRALRLKFFESQANLAEACGKPRNVISRLESPDYGKMSVSTLLELADTFDVGLQVRFVPFEEMANQIEDMSNEALAVPQFEVELKSAMTAHMGDDWRQTVSTGLDAIALADRIPKIEDKSALEKVINEPPARLGRFMAPPQQHGAIGAIR